MVLQRVQPSRGLKAARTHFWRFRDHEVAARPRMLRGFDIQHDGIPVATARFPFYFAEFTVQEGGRPVTYRLRIMKGPFPYPSAMGAEIERNGTHLVGTR